MKELLYPLVAIHHDGETIVADTREEAIGFRRLRPEAKHVSHWRPFVGFRNGEAVYEDRTTHHEWIVRDAEGGVVLHEELPERPRSPARWRRARIEAVRIAAERGLPIPGTGSRRRRHFRRFAMNVAMRADEAGLDADLAEWGLEGVTVGRKRAKLKLPQVWDDVAWRRTVRNWKDCRDTQWR